MKRHNVLMAGHLHNKYVRRLYASLGMRIVGVQMELVIDS